MAPLASRCDPNHPGAAGRKDLSTTMIYNHVLKSGPLVVLSPADLMWPFEQVVLGPVNKIYE
jgi:hypothetical protein